MTYCRIVSSAYYEEVAVAHEEAERWLLDVSQLIRTYDINSIRSKVLRVLTYKHMKENLYLSVTKERVSDQRRQAPPYGIRYE